ncbi:MAG: hypothetical protein AB7F22_07685 [Reyranella sp.]|uniref:hypothetical protein n=1 Tax=Reyranella sp. TaxID=1929291 RepID=UPI003D12EDB8
MKLYLLERGALSLVLANKKPAKALGEIWGKAAYTRLSVLKFTPTRDTLTALCNRVYVGPGIVAEELDHWPKEG